MNTLQSLIDNGIGEYNAKSMISNYSSKINKMNGVYIITDITYDFNSKGHDVTLKCTECGREIHRIMTVSYTHLTVRQFKTYRVQL